MLVAHAALAAACSDPLLSGFGEVGQDASVIVLDDCAPRDIYDKVVCRCARAALCTAGLAVLRLVQACVAHVEERGELLVHLEDYMTAAPAVTAVGPA